MPLQADLDALTFDQILNRAAAVQPDANPVVNIYPLLLEATPRTADQARASRWWPGSFKRLPMSAGKRERILGVKNDHL